MITARDAYGNAYVSTGIWPNGTIVFKPGGPGFVEPDGGLTMKFFWQKAGPEPLRVTGRRLDGDAPPLRFAPSQAEGHPEWVPSYVTFSAPGCWQVTARLEGRPETTLTFVTRVVKVGAGPGRAAASG